MRRILLLVVLTALFASRVWATQINVSSFQVPGYTYGGATAKLRIYASDSWTDSLGVPRIAGQAGSTTGFYQEISCVVDGTTLIIPSFTTPSTVDSIDRPQVRIAGVIFDSKGLRRETLFSNWMIPASPTPTTWQELVTYNASKPRPLNDNYATTAQVSQMILAALGSGAPDASDVVKGKSYLNVAPQTANAPVAIGSNWGRLNAIPVDISEYGDNLNNAVTAIGSVTQVTLAVSRPTLVTANVTVTSNITLKFVNDGYLDAGAGTWTVTCQECGLIAPPDRKLFYNFQAGQGTISILSRNVQEVYPEWWGASPSASAAVNTPALQAAIIGAYGNTRTNPSGLWIYNRTLKFSGIYDINNELQVYHMIGFRWEGQNKFNSGIKQTASNKRIIDGQSVSYGLFSNLWFGTTASQSGANMALIDLDYSGAQGNDLRPQNITIDNCVIHGNGGQGYIGIIIAKSGGGAQGDNLRITNTYINGFAQAGAQLGGGDNGVATALATNAINVQFNGGDIQGCPKYGLASYGGNWLVEDCTFENDQPPRQTGYDVFVIAGQRPSVMRNVVSESLRQAYGVNILENVQKQGWANLWTDAKATGLAVTNLLTGTPYGGDGKFYEVTVGGTFGGLGTTSATSGSATTIVNSGAAWVVDAFVGYRATIMTGPGKYQYGIVTANTATTITVGAGWVSYVQNLTITDPTSASTFVVEPNWGTQFTSGTVTWVLLDFNSIEGASSIRNVSTNGGKVITSVDFVEIQDLIVSRQDWMVTGATFLSGTYSTPNISRVLVARPGSNINSGQDPSLPWAFPRNSITGFTDITQHQKGREWTVWSRGQFGGGVAFPELGVGPGDNGSQTAAENNVLAFLGKLGRKTPFGTNQAGTATQIEGGRSTGSGAPGAIEFYMGAPGASGAAQNVGTLTAGIGANRIFWSFKGADVASATTITPTGNLFHVTGTTTITSVSGTGITAGTRVTIIFDGVLTFTDGGNLKLAGNFVTTADDTVVIEWDGSNWYEVQRSVN